MCHDVRHYREEHRTLSILESLLVDQNALEHLVFLGFCLPVQTPLLDSIASEARLKTTVAFSRRSIEVCFVLSSVAKGSTKS
jgi:hypothetical protein